MGRLVINGDEVYELDEECLKEKYAGKRRFPSAAEANRGNTILPCGNIGESAGKQKLQTGCKGRINETLKDTIMP